MNGDSLDTLPCGHYAVVITPEGEVDVYRVGPSLVINAATGLPVASVASVASWFRRQGQSLR